MCGIAGLIQAGNDQQAVFSAFDQERLWSMIGALKHRGPDGQFVWSNDFLGLAHARLSILDLESRSDQPFHDPDTGCILVYNGEIYNYLELKKELITLGYAFTTTSDTEVLLKAYLAWGPDCLNRFNGMWAFALYDPRSQTVFCARDRFGVKPFVYACLPHPKGNTLVFASESKALLAAYPNLAEVNIPFVQRFVTHGGFAAYEETFYSSIKNLLPGYAFVLRHGEQPKPYRYWDWLPEVHPRDQSDEALISQFRALLTDGIRLRFRSDVPVGVSLSGGLDSSSVVALASTAFNTSISTFSCVYPEHPAIDESEYIAETTAKFQTRAYQTQPQFPGDDDFLSVIRQSITEQDGPTGTPAVLSQRSVMALACQHVTVLLDGQGADEVLGGYHSYFPFSLASLMRDFRRKPSIPAFKAWLTAYRAIEFRKTRHTPSLFQAYQQAWKTFRASRKSAVYPARYPSLTVLDAVPAHPQDDLTTRLLQDLLFSSLPILLHYEDRNSMAYSIESRLPFLDYRLVEWVFRLPHTYKIRGSRTKWLLYEAVKDLLPPKVLNRRLKLGYETPGSNWFRGPKTAAWLNTILAQPPKVLADLPEAFMTRLRASWADCQAGKAIGSNRERVLWRYMTTCLWLENLTLQP